MDGTGRQGYPGAVGIRLRLYFFLVFTAMGIVIPFLPPWLEAQGLTGQELGYVLATLPLLGIAGPPVIGLLADVLRIRRSLLQLSCAASATVFLVAAGAFAGPITPSFLALLGMVAGFALFKTPMMLLADVAALEAKTDYGGVRLWGSIGFLVMALAAPVALDMTGAVTLPLAIGVLLTLTLGAALLLPAVDKPLPAPALGQIGRLLVSPDFVVFLAVAYLWMTSHSAYDVTVSRHLKRLGASDFFIGTCWATGTAAEVLLMAGSTRVIRRLGATGAFAVGASVMSLRWLAMGTISSLAILLPLQLLHAFSFGLCWTAMVAHVRERTPPSLLATGQGAFAGATALGGTTGALLWSPLMTQMGGALVFQIATLVGIGAVAASLLLGRLTSPGRLPMPRLGGTD